MRDTDANEDIAETTHELRPRDLGEGARANAPLARMRQTSHRIARNARQGAENKRGPSEGLATGRHPVAAKKQRRDAPEYNTYQNEPPKERERYAMKERHQIGRYAAPLYDGPMTQIGVHIATYCHVRTENGLRPTRRSGRKVATGNTPRSHRA